MNYKKSAEILFEEAEKLHLQPEWLTDYGLFSVVIKQKTYYLFYSYSMINNQLSGRLARDKHITRTILEKNNLPNIPYTTVTNKTEVAHFLRPHGEIIAKPILGEHAQHVYLIKYIDDLPALSYPDFIFEKYIKGEEWRYLVLGQKVIAVHRKYYETPINNPERVKRISYPHDKWKTSLVNLAIKSTQILNLSFAAVDFIIDKSQNVYILEINSVPGIWHFHHPAQGPSVNVAALLLEAMIENVK